MDKKEFLHKAKRLIVEAVAVQVNEILTGNKTSSAIATLFANYPINVDLRKLPEVAKKKSKLSGLATNVVAYTKPGNSAEMFVSIFYHKETDLTKILKGLEKHQYYLGYLYVREMLRLTRNHNTRAFFDMLKRHLVNTNIDRQLYYAYAMAASDIVVNSIIYKMYEVSSNEARINKILQYQRYVPNFEGDEIEALNIATKNYEMEFVEDGLFTIFGKEDDYMQFADFPINDEYNEIITDLGENLNKALVDASRGTATAAVFEELIQKEPIKQGQLKKFKKMLKKQVFEMTNEFDSTWSSLNSIYRKKFKAPSKKFYNHKLNIVLMIDQSGSVGDQALGKLLSLIEELDKKIAKLDVLIFDTEIVKTFSLKDTSKITSDPQFKKALGTRYQSGGTSHYACFQYLDDMPKNELDKTIVFSFSDNYSDIESSWVKFSKTMTLIPSVYFISPISNPVAYKLSGNNAIDIHLI